ncbi:MAG: nucleoside phosphorylase [Anaerolineae bacterium]
MTEKAQPVLERAQLPLLEYDPAASAVIEPRNLIKPLPGIKYCVLCYFNEVLTSLYERGMLVQIAEHGSEMGKLPLYSLEHNREVVIIQAPVGAPFAAAILDELITRGLSRFMVCGGCGVLDRSITVGHLLIPTCAVRDEGASFHYLPPSREVQANEAAVKALIGVLERHECPYLKVKTWTTDGFYRETPAKVALRRSEGCLVVEMEASAYMAVAQFRGAQLGCLLYAGDDVSGVNWDHRNWHNRISQREQVFWLAVEACRELA